MTSSPSRIAIFLGRLGLGVLVLAFGVVPALAAPDAKPKAPAAALRGFGQIPFGVKSDNALKLNHGNGKIGRSGAGVTTFSYAALIGGLEFQVVHNFDTEDRAADVKLTYNSREKPGACTDRFNYVLAQLTGQYGAPATMPAMRREGAGAAVTDRHTVQFAFANKSGIRADLMTTYPAGASGAAAAGGAGASGAGAGAGGAQVCQITMHYLPGGWLAQF